MITGNRRASFLVAILFSAGLIAGLEWHGGGPAAPRVAAQENGGDTPAANLAPSPAMPDSASGTAVAVEDTSIGSVSTEAPGVRVRATPLIPGAPLTAFTVVVPVTFSGEIAVTVRPSAGELALAGGDPTNLQVINLLSNASVPCTAVASQLQCTVDQPGRYAVAVNPEIDSGRGPAPIRIDPGQAAGIVSVGPPPAPAADPNAAGP